MKKFIFMIMALVISTFTMSAQTVTSSKFTDNIYVGASVGTSGIVSPKYNGYGNFWDTMNFTTNLRIGKWITPKFLLELEGNVGFSNLDDDLGVLNLDNKTVRTTDVLFNMGFNLNNIIHRYKGIPDKVEFVPVVGIGWTHNYGTTKDDIMTKGALQINTNLNDKFQFNIIPSVGYRFANGVNNFNKNNMEVELLVGFTYKFKNSNGTHHFTLCDKKYTQAEFDEINKKLNESIAKMNKQEGVIDTQNKEISDKNKEIEDLRNRPTSVNNIYINQVVGFNVGESKISSLNDASLEKLAYEMNENKDLKLKIVGYSDAKTGSDERNMELSLERANSVKEALVNLGVDADRITVEGKGSTEQPFVNNDSNRAVIFVLNK